MKRDIEIIRRLLLKAEAAEVGEVISVTDPTDANHVALLVDEGFVKARLVEVDGDGIIGARIFRLTNQGHDFIQSAMDQTIWNKMKDTIIKPGAAWTLSLVVEYLKQEAKRHLGMNLD